MSRIVTHTWMNYLTVCIRLAMSGTPQLQYGSALRYMSKVGHGILSDFIKQLTLVAREQSALNHTEYIQTVTTNFMPAQLVFIAESTCDWCTTCHGWAWVVKVLGPFPSASLCRWNSILLSGLKKLTRYSILPSLSLSGILHVNIVTGYFDTTKPTEFIDILLTQMNLFPCPDSVIVMDSCQIHKASFFWTW